MLLNLKISVVGLSFIFCSVLSGQNSFKNKSVLAEGQIFKFSIPKSGVYKITKNLLDKSGIPANTDPDKIRIFAFPGGHIDEQIKENEFINDLYELPVEISGGEDGRFDANDEIYFYCEGPDIYRFDNAAKKWNFIKNIYSTKSYIYVVIDQQNSKKIKEYVPGVQTSLVSDRFELRQSFEEDKLNLLTLTINTQGSGQQWFGDNLKGLEGKPINALDLNKFIAGEEISVEAIFAARSANSGTIDLNIGSEKLTRNTNGVFLNSIETSFASIAGFETRIKPASLSAGVSVSYKTSGNSGDAWVDYIRLTGYSRAVYNGEQVFVSDRALTGKSARILFQTGNYDVKAYKLNNFNNYESVNFTNKELTISSENTLSEFILFHRAAVPVPDFEKKLPNQNLHSHNGARWLIIYPDTLKEQANILAKHRNQYMSTSAVSLEQVLEEFGGGRKDPTAIRNFCRMIFERNKDFKYLLLLGDATYDARNIQNENGSHLHIPVYQTANSLHPVFSFPSDDYYGLLTGGEGGDLIGSIEVAVGRLPVKNYNEAKSMIKKIIEYDTNPDRFGPWRNNVVISADDEDGNLHVIQADRLAKTIEKNTPEFLVRKKYMDASTQISTPAGQRYPNINLEINNEMNTGTLVFCYLGHGGPNGLAEERVVQVTDIQSWKNIPKLPVMVTATCTFTGYDNPKNVSAGEYAILNDQGGAIALYSTVRAVYASENERITNSVFNFLLPEDKTKSLTFGDILISAKNFQRFDTISANTRKFALFGDPGQIIAVPGYKIYVDSINGIKSESFSDTITAFQKINLSGFVSDHNNNSLQNFNGKIYITVYDKTVNLKTLANDPQNSYKFEFDQFRNIVFRGQASVNNGRWNISFIVPSDINYSIGKGKILLYAHSSEEDASGVFDNITIGGEPKSAFRDDNPPQMNLFINDTNFKNGGITNNKPVLIVHLKDDTGIKVTGNSIGHDLTAQLSGPLNRNIILNDFYTGNLNDPSSGTVRYLLPQLPAGRYSLRVKAWDLGNNSVTQTIEFEIKDENLEIELPAYAYPNPFTNATRIHFEHDFNGQEVELHLSVYDVSGREVHNEMIKKTTTGSAEEFVLGAGTDPKKQGLISGIYFYKIKIKSVTLNKERESGYRKLLKF
jgi:hypothetical protein